MLYDVAWHARISRVLSGALGVWGVAGTVEPDPTSARGFRIAPRTGAALRVGHDLSQGWSVTRGDSAFGEEIDLGRHAGLPGLLRRLRDELAPDAPGGSLLIGAQQILGRDDGVR